MNIECYPRSLTLDSLHQPLSIQTVGEETLVYDEARHLAFCLDRTATVIWNLANGRRSTADVAAAASITLAHPVTSEVVEFTFARLAADGLLALPEANQLSRRTMLSRLGAGAALMLPVIAVIAAPKAAQAYNVGVSGVKPVTPTQADSVQHEKQLGLPTYDPNHVHDSDSAADDDSTPEESH